MSRVVYENTPATADQEALRQTHRVQPIDAALEGSGVNVVPGGVYGFTYSPGLPNSPLFRQRRYRSYEVHKLASGETMLIGFATREMADRMSPSGQDVTVVVLPEPTDAANVLVAVPYSRIRQHRQYAAPNQDGFTVTLVGI